MDTVEFPKMTSNIKSEESRPPKGSPPPPTKPVAKLTNPPSTPTDIIEKYFILPPNIFFWSIALQENICSSSELIIKITNISTDNDFVFGTIQTKLMNTTLSFIANKDMTSYLDRPNGEIFVNYGNLIKM